MTDVPPDIRTTVEVDAALERVVDALDASGPPTGVGVDVVAFDRIGRYVSAEALLHRIATDDEIERVASAREVARLVTVKEAAAKALGTGIVEAVGWTDLIVPSPTSEPFRVTNCSEVEAELWGAVESVDDHAVAVAVSNVARGDSGSIESQET